MKKRLFVFSIDAMVQEDADYLRKKPGSHFSKFYENCSGLESVRSIYPTITYPVHVSIQTGCYPDRHGVLCNYVFGTDFDNYEWTYDYRNIKCETIFEAAKRGGYTTGGVFWPVTANNPYIDYHVPEYWMPHKGDTLPGTYMELGTSAQMAEIMKKNAHRLPEGYEKTGKENFAVQPYFDDFLIHVALDTIRECQPEVMFVHACLVDSYRHSNGIFNAKVTEALDQMDEWLGDFFRAYQDIGHFDDTNFVILSDHGQMDAIRKVRPNVYLAEKGLIDVDENGKVRDYTVYGIHNGHSMTFFMKDPTDKAAYEKAYQTLQEMAAQEVYGFRQVLTREEAAEQYHLDGDFAFIIESDGYSYFGDQVTRPMVTDLPLKDYRMGIGDHGHLPDRGPQPVFLVKGPDFKENVMLPRRDIVDEAPTFAKLLGVDLPQAQGVAMDELLR